MISPRRTITEKINEVFGEGTAFAMDGVSLAVRAPVGLSGGLVVLIENLDVEPGIPAARWWSTHGPGRWSLISK